MCVHLPEIRRASDVRPSGETPRPPIPGRDHRGNELAGYPAAACNNSIALRIAPRSRSASSDPATWIGGSLYFWQPLHAAILGAK